MILSCNACGKKFVVPDNAISASGRVVQCGSCGNKWRQFPQKKEVKVTIDKSSNFQKSKPHKTKRSIKKTNKKPREISLYSPEYLAKKHGIKINDTKTQKVASSIKKEKVSFGFYSSLIVFIFLIISLSRILYFSEEFIISIFPGVEYYLNYFFESIKNIFEIWKNLITSY